VGDEKEKGAESKGTAPRDASGEKKSGKPRRKCRKKVVKIGEERRAKRPGVKVPEKSGKRPRSKKSL